VGEDGSIEESGDGGKILSHDIEEGNQARVLVLDDVPVWPREELVCGVEALHKGLAQADVGLEENHGNHPAVVGHHFDGTLAGLDHVINRLMAKLAHPLALHPHVKQSVRASHVQHLLQQCL